MSYVERVPPPALAPYVDRLWSRTQSNAGVIHRVLPDGCVDLLVLVDMGVSVVVGAMTSAALVSSSGTIAAARFRPGGAAALLGVPAHELTDLHVPLGELVGQRLAGRLSVGADQALEDFLLERAQSASGLDRLVAHVASALSGGDAPTMKQLAEDTGYTRQYLTRRFTREVGLGPKLFARIARMQRTLAAVRRSEVRRGATASLASELGYFDQAHLIHELRELTGATPGEIARDPGSFSPILSLFGEP
ncbi:MAG: AraC family transcriptional regulator [Polyangiaceae bacterium]